MPDSPEEIRNEYLRELKKEIEEIKQEQAQRGEARLREKVEKLSDKATKIASSTMSLQSKITELLIKMTDNLEAQKKMIKLLEEATTIEEESPLKSAVETLVKQNRNLLKELNEHKRYLKRISRAALGESKKSEKKEWRSGKSSYGRY